MPAALIITAAGINCDRELGRAFSLAGADPEFIHLNRLVEQPDLIDRFQLIGLPGGFSFGDAIAAGRIMAQLMRQHLYEVFVRAIDRGVPIIAPCNGFQIAVQMGLLPGPFEGDAWPTDPPPPSISLGQNQHARFIDRWLQVELPSQSRCLWTRNLEGLSEVQMMLPIAHGEGRFIPASSTLLSNLVAHGQIALRYAEHDNLNGSVDCVAGICDRTGLVFGLMPHPERFYRWTQHPIWTRLDDSIMQTEPLGLAMFKNAVKHATQHVVAC